MGSWGLPPEAEAFSKFRSSKVAILALLASLLLGPSYRPLYSVAQANSYSPAPAFTPAQAFYAAQVITTSPAAARSPAQSPVLTKFFRHWL